MAGEPGPYRGLRMSGESEFQNEKAAAAEGISPAVLGFFVLKKGDAKVTNGVWSEDAYDAVTLVGLVGIPAKE